MAVHHRHSKEPSVFFIELFVSSGTLSEERRQQIAERLPAALVDEDMAAAQTATSAQAFTPVAVHELAAWAPATPADPPRYLVRVSVPGAWRKELVEHAVERITKVLADADEDPERLYREPHAWVQVVGISERSYGVFGKVQGSDDIATIMTEPYRRARTEGSLAEPPPGKAYDPQCGALMSLDEASVTLEWDGTTHPFCCAGCRDEFVKAQRVAAS